MYSFLLPTSLRFDPLMTYNTTASLDKLTCTDYMDVLKCQDRFGQISSSKNNSNYLVFTLKVFKRNSKKSFLAAFDQFTRLTNQLVNATKTFGREENLSSVLIPTMSKDMEEQFKLAHSVDVVHRATRNVFVTLLRYNVDKTELSCVQVWSFARKKEDKKVQRIVYVKHKPEKIISLLDALNNV